MRAAQEKHITIYEVVLPRKKQSNKNLIEPLNCYQFIRNMEDRGTC